MLSIYRIETNTIPLNPNTIPPNSNTIPPNPCKYVNGVYLENLTNLPTFHFFFNCLVGLLVYQIKECYYHRLACISYLNPQNMN